MSIEKVAIVFGGAGFIGTHLIRALKKDPNYTRIIAADIRTALAPLEGVEYVQCDVREPITLPCFNQPVEIYNLAAVHTTPGHEDWEYFWTNIRGAVEVTRFAEKIGAKTVVFTSSISIYGPAVGPRDESGPFLPESAYGRSKLIAEDIHRTWQASGPERQLVIVRPAVIFGAGEHGNFTRLADAMKRNVFVYPGRTDTIKACGYVGELVRTILFVRDCGAPETTYNFAFPERYTTKDICHAFHKVAGFAEPRFTFPLSLMLAGGMVFEILAALGVKTSVNRKRVLKLITPTNILPTRLTQLGYKFEVDLEAAILSWKNDSTSGEFV